MQILGRINLPKSAEISGLYVQCNDGASINRSEERPEIVFNQGGLISSNSYFNSFYENYYAKYTTLGVIYYLLRLQGDFKVSIYREVYGEDNKQLVCQTTFNSCELSDFIKIELPNIQQTKNPGRLYFEIICLSEKGLLTEGLITTNETPTREVSLAIVSCTFKKEEYIKKTVNTVLEDDLMRGKKFKIFVVDNGSTLSNDDFKDSRVQLIYNRNVGGSGGFTRGLVEALQSNTFSHFLLMDDDVELDSESVYRLFSLYENAKFDIAVAGSMIDLYKKYLLHEAGAAYGKSSEIVEFGPFSAVPLKHNLDLQKSTSLNLLLLEESIDFGGFWFFAFSRQMLEAIGLPLPLFIKVDDIEFCLRIKEHFGDKIVAFPSIAVWHEPFYAKFPVWDNYYNSRNHLIANAIHNSLPYPIAFYQLTKAFFFVLWFFEYNSAEMIVKGVEDYLKGPDFIKNNEPETLHSKIVQLSKAYNTQKLQQNSLPSSQSYQESKPGVLKKIISLLTFNGHLLPNFLTSDDEVLIWQGPGYTGQRTKALGKKRVLLFKEESGFLLQNEINKLAGLKLLTRWFQLALKSSIKWSSISQQWKNAAKELSSTNFWQEYLGIKDKA